MQDYKKLAKNVKRQHRKKKRIAVMDHNTGKTTAKTKITIMIKTVHELKIANKMWQNVKCKKNRLDIETME